MCVLVIPCVLECVGWIGSEFVKKTGKINVFESTEYQYTATDTENEL
jgi:hypothetical protein